MGVIHELEAVAEGAIAGLQAQQRDWSPFVAHFTTASAMLPLRGIWKNPLDPATVQQLLAPADATSWATFQKIMASGKILASSLPSGSIGNPRVCLSECTLPGLISHTERFGRFGLVFRKSDILSVGGGSCVYVSRPAYGALVGQRANSSEFQRLSDLANVHSPPGSGAVQDFTHEREWRVVGDIDLRTVTPVAFVVPSVDYIGGLPAQCDPRIPVVPLKLLQRWGV
ncbi:MAG TPA: hypothetical protein VFF67_08895 [Thermoplasmata archaeon]|nr:hypothetical protein [Thermoplasmata archaeon]